MAAAVRRAWLAEQLEHDLALGLLVADAAVFFLLLMSFRGAMVFSSSLVTGVFKNK